MHLQTAVSPRFARAVKGVKAVKDVKPRIVKVVRLVRAVKRVQRVRAVKNVRAVKVPFAHNVEVSHEYYSRTRSSPNFRVFFYYS